MKVNSHFYDLLVKNEQDTKKNILVFQGGSGSGKTYSILQFFIIKCTSGEWQNETIDIVRDTFPFLRISAMKDFFDILESEGLYDENRHNKSENTYRIGTNKIRFYSADDKEKTKGPRRTRLYLNEVLGFKKSTVDQLMMRTSKKVYMDYNPSEEFSWVYDDILPDERTLFDKSNFLHNPFIPEVSKEHIKKYKQTDPNLWRIYGLGERGVSHTTIFFNWEQTDCTWERAEGEEVFGCDFGYNDETALVRAKYHEKGIYAEELLFKSGLTSDAIVLNFDRLREQGKIKYTDKIICDSARPEIIEDLRRAGYNVWKAKKGDESVLRGINFIKKYRIFLNEESTNMIKEFRGYKWQVDKDERVLDFPVQLNDHCIDSLRYALEDKSRNRKTAGFGEV